MPLFVECYEQEFLLLKVLGILWLVSFAPTVVKKLGVSLNPQLIDAQAAISCYVWSVRTRAPHSGPYALLVG